MKSMMQSLRLARSYPSTPVELSAYERVKIRLFSEENQRNLDHNYFPGFGVFPSADPDSNYFNQVWTRDFAHAAGNYYAETNPFALTDSLNTILRYQRRDGSLPSRVEREYELVKFIPVVRQFSRPIFNFIEGTCKGRIERPVYEGQNFAGGEDTVPAIVIAAGEFYLSSPQGKDFAVLHFEKTAQGNEVFQE